MPRLDEVRKVPTRSFNIRISEELHDELSFKADELGIKVSELIRRVLSDFIHHRH